jgi:hypothetical protein
MYSCRHCPKAADTKFPLLLPPAQPVRDHFENNAEAKALLKQVKSFKITK